MTDIYITGTAATPCGKYLEKSPKEIAAEADNGSGTPGVCPDCSVLVLRVTYALIEEGELVVPQGPGLGVELDWEEIERRTVAVL